MQPIKKEKSKNVGVNTCMMDEPSLDEPDDILSDKLFQLPKFNSSDLSVTPLSFCTLSTSVVQFRLFDCPVCREKLRKKIQTHNKQ